VSDLERLRREELEEAGTAAYVSVALGIGLLVTTVFIISTAGVLAAGFPFVIAAALCLGWGISRFARQRRALPSSGDGERELLSALREHGGSITPAEAAMETSLTVKEADRMLSQLASGTSAAREPGRVAVLRAPSQVQPATRRPVSPG
jgi:hypothetical protein